MMFLEENSAGFNFQTRCLMSFTLLRVVINDCKLVDLNSTLTKTRKEAKGRFS